MWKDPPFNAGFNQPLRVCTAYSAYRFLLEQGLWPRDAIDVVSVTSERAREWEIGEYLTVRRATAE